MPLRVATPLEIWRGPRVADPPTLPLLFRISTHCDTAPRPASTRRRQSMMSSRTPALLLLAALLAPTTAFAQGPLGSVVVQQQRPFASPPQIGALAAGKEGVARSANPSVVVHVVDPLAPSTLLVAAPTPLAMAEEDAEQDDAADDDEDASEYHFTDSPNFGRACDFGAGAFRSCGDYFDAESEIDHGLFCSPAGICAGKGAACGATEACLEGEFASDLLSFHPPGRELPRTDHGFWPLTPPLGLVCDLDRNRCTEPTAKLLGIDTARRTSRRESAAARCPHRAEACPNGHGGFECVYTLTDDAECGACRGLGGRDCAKIEHALATSCRKGACVVREFIIPSFPTRNGIDVSLASCRYLPKGVCATLPVGAFRVHEHS